MNRTVLPPAAQPQSPTATAHTHPAASNKRSRMNRRTKSTGLRAKILRVFALQVLLISLATLLGIFFTNSIVQDVLMRSALEGEATHYWTLYENNPNQPLPNTDNLMGYLVRDANYESIPEAVHQIGREPGYHRGQFDGNTHIVHVSDNYGARLFLVFDSDSVSDLAFFFGIVPLSIVLLLVYGLMLFAYRMSQRAVSPIVRLANYLEEFEFSAHHATPLNLGPLRELPNSEVAAMIEALDHFTDRVNAFVERERYFTRDASHELRTPVAVFKGSLDLLEKNSQRSEADTKSLARMRRTVNDMEGLIETLLLLATEQTPPKERVNVNAIVDQQVEQLSDLARQAGNDVSVSHTDALHVFASARVVQILITNLLRNAIAYTNEGTISIIVADQSITITDSGIGMTTEELASAFDPFFRGAVAREKSKGHGLGLSIVKRLVTLFDWRIDASSQPGHGTSVRVNFAHASADGRIE